ncbi:MAG: hypothetical protein KDD12_13945 [Lewinella sp.]|nr:hypothetical protein [Lewinella sp.]
MPSIANRKNRIRITKGRLTGLFFLLTWLWGAPLSGAPPATPRFTNDQGLVSESGYFKLIWATGKEPAGVDNAPEFLLQQSTDSNFGSPVVLYQGPDLATFISGLENGTYYFRLKAIDPQTREGSAWTAPLAVVVRHHPLALSLTLFGLGAIVFLATLAIVVSGARATRANQEA